MGSTPTAALIATRNRHKLEEIRLILDGVGVELRGLEGFDVTEPEETGETFLENARAKARYYALATGWPSVSDDSGLEIDALSGAPGVRSARYNGASYPEKFASLYRELRLRGGESSTARFVCAVAFAGRDGGILFEHVAAVEGRIAPAPRGAGGFGYDPIFFYPPYGRTLAEVSAQEKAAVSHRGQAFRALARFLKQER
jgi:XTP/dITP diphosphohydrolase